MDRKKKKKKDTKRCFLVLRGTDLFVFLYSCYCYDRVFIQ